MTNTGSSRGKIQELLLDKLDVGTAQVRTDLTSGIEDLAENIRKQGLIHPIVVSEHPSGRYEILAGQRRFLAHQELGYKTIRALVLDEEDLDDIDKVSISLSENLMREDNKQKELIDACTKLFKRYGSIKMIAEETGLKATLVSQYVKYDQLVPDLKKMVDNAKLDMKVALQAQKAAAGSDGSVDEEAAIKYATELKPLSDQQRKKFVTVVQQDPTASLEEKIERGRKQPVLKQVVVTLEESLHVVLQSFAKEEGVNQNEAAASLIEDGLARRDLLGD